MARREKRKRKRRPQGPRPDQPATPPPAAPVAAAPRKSRDEIAREGLVPLREGERPLAITIAAAVAGLLVAGWAVAFVFGDSGVRAGAPFAILLAAAAVGMWQSRYWAVLGFQVVLALTFVNSILFVVIRANSVLDVVVGLAIAGSSGTLFWFLIRAMARIQMPERRPRDAAE